MMFACVVLGFLQLWGTTSGRVDKTAAACYNVITCDHLHLDCSDDQSIFIMSMQYGFKYLNSTCWTSSSCGACCSREAFECLSPYVDDAFGKVYTNDSCWNKEACSSKAYRTQTGCAGSAPNSTFVLAQYSCLKRTDITDFYQNTRVVAPAVAIHYNASDVSNYLIARGDNQTWHCQVDPKDSLEPSIDVIVVKESDNLGSTRNCSSVGWTTTEERFLPCSTALRYRSASIRTPLKVSVRVFDDARLPNGWAVVRSRDGRDIAVTCGNLDETTTALSVSSTSTGPSTPLPSASSASTRRKTAAVTSDSTPRQERSVVTSEATSTGTLQSKEMTSATTSAERGNQQGNGEEGTNTWTVVGAVLAAVAVLVAAALGVFCFVRQRKLAPRSILKPPSNRKSSLHMPLTPLTPGTPSTSQTLDHLEEGSSGRGPSEMHNPAFVTAMDQVLTQKAYADGQDYRNYTEIPDETRRQHGQATAPGLHGNPKSPAEEPDYDLLGHKKSQNSSSNPATTYGRLGEVGGGGEDTDYNYDHLARGRQAAPDVINSDYDTSALHMTSEGDYNVAGIPRKQQVITGSNYDTAEIVTSEGDYNRVDFQGKKQHVITGSDYDTAEIVTSEGDYNRVDFQSKKQHVITGSDYDTAEIVTSEGD